MGLDRVVPHTHSAAQPTMHTPLCVGHASSVHQRAWRHGARPRLTRRQAISFLSTPPILRQTNRAGLLTGGGHESHSGGGEREEEGGDTHLSVPVVGGGWWVKCGGQVSGSSGKSMLGSTSRRHHRPRKPGQGSQLAGSEGPCGWPPGIPPSHPPSDERRAHVGPSPGAAPSHAGASAAGRPGKNKQTALQQS